MKITVTTVVDAPLHEVWRAYTTPEDIKAWNAASPDWHTTASTVDLRPGGRFSSRMEARDGSFGFDFEGEASHSEAQQREGRQAILDNFARHVKGKPAPR